MRDCKQMRMLDSFLMLIHRFYSARVRLKPLSRVSFIIFGFLILKAVAKYQSSKMKLYFDKSNGLFLKFLRKSKIQDFVYTPSVLTLTPLLQSLFYLVLEKIEGLLYRTTYMRELLRASDGGTLGIDWVNMKPDVNSTKPILLCFPGLTLGNDNNYTKSLITATKGDYRCGVALLRGAPGLPITCGKFSCCASYPDVKEIIDYVYSKYIKPYKNRSFYGYGVSLGALLIGNYLWRAEEETPLNAVILYSVPWNVFHGAEYFFNQWIYPKALGLNLNKILTKRLPYMRKYLTSDEYKRIENVLKNNWKGMIPIEEQIYARQYNFKDRRDYWQDISLNYQNRLRKIRVPTFALSSQDDFLCNPKLTPRQSVCGEKGSMLISAETKAGCHCCHLTGNGLFRIKHWFPKPLVVFLNFIESERQKYDSLKKNRLHIKHCNEI